MSMQGTIERLAADHASGVIVDVEGHSYPFDVESLVDTDLGSIRIGDSVEFDLGGAGGSVSAIRLIDKPKAEAPTPGLANAPDLEPPPDIARDQVAEASWESFPASDSPSGGQIT